MPENIIVENLDKAEGRAVLKSYLLKLAEDGETIYTESAPNGVVSAKRGKIAIYKNGSTYEQWQNIDGGTTWQRMDVETKGLLDVMEYSSDALAQEAYVTDATEGSGPEIVLNGTAWTGATGSTPPNSWDILDAGYTHTIESGTLKLISPGSYAFALQQIITTVVGHRYKASIDIKNGNATYGVQMNVGTIVRGAEYGSLTDSGTAGFTTKTLTFTATETSLYLSIYANTGTAGHYGWVDNCTVKDYALQSYSESTIKTQGSYALKAVAAITDSLNKTLTRTISPTINLSNVNTLRFDIRSTRTGANIKIGIHDSGGTTTEKTYTVLAADTWETVTWDISAVANADKDAIDSIIITIVNADAANTFYIDNFYAILIYAVI